MERKKQTTKHVYFVEELIVIVAVIVVLIVAFQFFGWGTSIQGTALDTMMMDRPSLIRAVVFLVGLIAAWKFLLHDRSKPPMPRGTITNRIGMIVLSLGFGWFVWWLYFRA